jgi:hypothetical protein
VVDPSAVDLRSTADAGEIGRTTTGGAEPGRLHFLAMSGTVKSTVESVVIIQ